MTSPCELVQIEYQGNGSQVIFPFPFPYEFKSEIKVAIWNNTQKRHVDILTTDATYPWEVSDANPTAVTFTSTAPPTPPASGVNEDPIFNVRIYRTTDLTDIRAVFNQGSAIRATDLNRNFDQLRSAIQEGKCQVSDKVFEYLEEYYWNKFDETIYSTANGGTWVSNDQKIPSTAAADERFVDHVNNETIGGVKTFTSSPVVPTPSSGNNAANKTYVDTEINDKINLAITNDIGTDGTGITVTDDGDGTITLGLADNSIDFDKIKGVDIITEAEQDAGSPAPADNNILTALAAARRFDTIVQPTTPSGSDWEVGKTWLQTDVNKTLSVWNGTGWIGVASGGTFTNQPTVIYVDSVNGDDINDGHRIINPKKTIKNAVASASAGDIIRVSPGVYQEILPIDITVANLSIVGDAQRSCFVHPTPATETETMFRCNSGTYIDGFTFVGLKATGARGGHPVDNDPTYGLPTTQGWVAGFYPGCVIRKSPFINNCTSFADSGIDNSNFDPNNYAGTGGDTTSAPTGGGIFVDGSLPSVSSPLRSFVINEFTQVNLDGPGLLVANNGYAQAVSFFGLFCHYHAKALSGGQINMEVGTTDFGRYGLIADGKSTTPIFTATANGNASAGAITFAVNAPTAAASWFGDVTRPALNMLVQIGANIYPILSSSPNGSGWNVTISRPNPANRAENLGLISSISNGAAVQFYLRSMISTASHTMEYAGSGTNYNALPENGGVPVEANEAISRNNGKVWLTSTDQSGKFKVGDTFVVDQQTGFVNIDPNSYGINVVSDLTPQLGGNLDVLDKTITTSTTNGDIDLDANGSGLVKVTEYNLSQVPVVTQHDIGPDPDEISLNGMLGTMAFQDADGVNIGTASFGAGSAASPSITFTGDTNTGVYSPGADALAFSTNGTERVRVQDNGRVGIGTASANSLLHVSQSGGPTIILEGNSADNGALLGAIKAETTASLTTDNPASIRFLSNGSAGGHHGGSISFWTNPQSAGGEVERARITRDGNLLVGTTANTGYLGITTCAAQFVNTDTVLALGVERATNDQNSASFVFRKTRATAPGGVIAVTNNDKLGMIRFAGTDGANSIEAASIEAVVDGNIGTRDMPGRLVFSTTADGMDAPTERMRIKSNGTINFSNVAVYADNAAATTGGLAVGDVYRTSTGQLMIRY